MIYLDNNNGLEALEVNATIIIPRIDLNNVKYNTISTYYKIHMKQHKTTNTTSKTTTHH